jgi:pyruvate/2-oxoglutarate dehydrogenase complex dihydrolipoamide acyltransferase (E2) component
MPIISIRIPQLGEGLQEALLVELLKQPGDTVARDEPIYVMETDKASTDVESPYGGTLIEWVVEPGTVLAIGAEVARIEVPEGIQETSAGHPSGNTGHNTGYSGSGGFWGGLLAARGLLATRGTHPRTSHRLRSPKTRQPNRQSPAVNHPQQASLRKAILYR